MKQKTLLLSATFLSFSFSSAVFASPPTLGDTTVKTEVTKGVTVTEGEKRFVLPSGKLAGENTTLIQANAVIESVDKERRSITIRTADGRVKTLRAGEEVRNFGQIEPKDKVNVEYYLSVAFETREPTETEVLASGDLVALAGSAALGDKPAAGAAQGQVKVMTIESIDKVAQTVQLKDPNGIISTVKAKYPENLALASKGDKVVITITEALAASVTEVN